MNQSREHTLRQPLIDTDAGASQHLGAHIVKQR